MKIYVAASYPMKQKARDLASELKRQGHRIVSEWIHRNEGYEPINSSETPSQIARRLHNAADTDIDEVRECEVMIQFTEGIDQTTSGGRHSELGMALVFKKKIIIIGRREQVFHYHKDITAFKTVEDMEFSGVLND